MAGRRKTTHTDLPTDTGETAPLEQFLLSMAQMIQEQSRIQQEQVLMQQEQNRNHQEQLRMILANQSWRPTAPAPPTHGGNSVSVCDRFLRLNSREFKGASNPLEAEGWIKSLEKTFELMQLPDDDKVRCATYMLTGDALTWWDSVKMTVAEGTLTWSGFKELFFEKYFSVDDRNQLARDFLAIQQGTQSVSEYVKRLDRGCKFVPMIGESDAEKLKHFCAGLIPPVEHDVHVAQVSTFPEAVALALRSEKDLKKMDNYRQLKRPAVLQKDQGRFVKRGGTRPVSAQRPPARVAQAPTVPDRQPCKSCGKVQFGECRLGSQKCFHCKQEGHFARFCPKFQEPVRGRVFALTEEKVDPDTAVITDAVDEVNEEFEFGGEETAIEQ